MIVNNEEIASFKEANALYGEYYNYNKENIDILLNTLYKLYSPIILWGAGLKGKAFLERFDKSQKRIDFLIDMDLEKQGQTLLTGHKILGITNVSVENSIILVVNANYYPSICFSLINNGFDIKKLRIICIDHYIDGKFHIEDIKNNTIWERKRYYD